MSLKIGETAVLGMQVIIFLSAFIDVCSVAVCSGCFRNEPFKWCFPLNFCFRIKNVNQKTARKVSCNIAIFFSRKLPNEIVTCKAVNPHPLASSSGCINSFDSFSRTWYCCSKFNETGKLQLQLRRIDLSYCKKTSNKNYFPYIFKLLIKNIVVFNYVWCLTSYGTCNPKKSFIIPTQSNSL